jgi:hypothetical protein
MAGASDGLATVTGALTATVETAGLADGTAIVEGFRFFAVDGAGLAAGVATVHAPGEAATKLSRPIIGPGLALDREDEVLEQAALPQAITTSNPITGSTQIF